MSSTIIKRSQKRRIKEENFRFAIMSNLEFRESLHAIREALQAHSASEYIADVEQAQQTEVAQ